MPQADQQHLPATRPPSGERAVEGLLVADLGIAKALAAGGRVRLWGRGGCMAPQVREGDRLQVVPRAASQIEVGDVVVFRRAGRWLVHRAIATGRTAEGAYVLTRADRSRAGSDGPSFDRDILGVVSRIERRGGITLPRWAMAVVAWLQDRAAYRFAARCWLAQRQQHLRYAVYAPLHADQRCDVNRKLSLAEFATLSLLPEAGGVDRASLLVWIGAGAWPAARAEFVAATAPGGEPCWMLATTHVRRRFQGTGIDRWLEAQADALFAHRTTRLLKTGSR